MAVSGEEFRESDWAVRDIFDVLAGCANPYYSLRGDADDELGTGRVETEALMPKSADLREKNGGLRGRIVPDQLVKRWRGNDNIGFDRVL